MIKFNERLKSLREETKLSQNELAKILNFKQRTISNWEIGDRECDFETLVKIAKYFNVTTDYLLGLTDF